MIAFGTSGFRGVIGDNYTKENVQKVAYAICEISKKDKINNAEIVIGYDNRFMSKDFAKWTAEVLATTMKVRFYPFPTPTPLVCFEAKKLDYGLMLTASHNPYRYNGMKVFLRGGRDCDDEFARRVEKIANKVKTSEIKTMEFDDAIKNKRIVLVKDIKKYCNSVLSFIDVKKIRKSNLKILANTMHGSVVECIKNIFNSLELNYEIMNENVDPYFDGRLPAPYKQNLLEQAKRVKKEKFDLGVAFDGDGDRFSIVSSSGKFYDSSFVGAVLYYYLVKIKGYKASITKSYPLTSLCFKLANSFESNCYESVVGFKNIAKMLMETDSIIGIESNGVAFKPQSLSKDGPMTAALIIDALCTLGKSFDEILNDLQKAMNFKSEVVEYNYPITKQQQETIYKLLFEDKKVPEIKGKKILKVGYEDGCKILYENDYWGMIRFSGTEPLVRLYVEMKDAREGNKVIAQYEKFLGIKEKQ